jgi:hypothetical protein
MLLLLLVSILGIIALKIEKVQFIKLFYNNQFVI